MHQGGCLCYFSNDSAYEVPYALADPVERRRRWIWELAKVKWGMVGHTLLSSRRSSNRGHKLSHDMTKLEFEGAGESGWWRWWRFWKRSQCFCCCCWIWWGGGPQGSGTGCGENHDEREGDDKKEAGENFIMSMIIYFFNRIILMICLYVYFFVWPILKYGSKGRNLVSLLDGIFGSNLQVQFVSCPLVIKDGNMAMGNPTYLVGGLEHLLIFHILGIIIPTD